MTSTARKNLLADDVYRECRDRIGRLTRDTRPQWGTMSVAQMLAHCAEIQEVSNGKELKNTPFLAKLFRGMIRNMVVGDKPFPKGARTHPQYKQTSERDFETEKTRLLESLETFVRTDPVRLAALSHPLFGRMSLEEKGWAMYKHLDHHLSQFGV